jgi:hypothetical protein
MGSAVSKSLTHCLTILLACVIALSFGLHTVEQKHVHFGSIHSEEHEKGTFSYLSEYAHGTEKKAFVILLLGIIAASLYVVWNEILYQLTLLYKDQYKRVFKERSSVRRFDYLAHLLSCGILNPKYF